MGCGGSKEEVAVGNTVPTKSLSMAKAEGPKVFAEAENANANDKEGTNISSTKLSMTEGRNEIGSKEAIEGKVISKDSPDRYFSSRKEEAAMAGVTEVASIADEPAVDAFDSTPTQNDVIMQEGESQLNAGLDNTENAAAKSRGDSEKEPDSVVEAKDSEASTTSN